MNWKLDQTPDHVRVQVKQDDIQDVLPELVKLELSLRSQQIAALTLMFDPDVAIPTQRLERLDYRRLAPYEYTKPLSQHRSARFSITEKCNYRCFFCHEEGLDMEHVRQEAEDQALFKVLDQLQGLGYNDLTFTGGEPLLKWRQILRCLDYMQRIDYRPDIKFVSNGRALNAAFLEGLKKYSGKIRFNLSMHSLDPVVYNRIVHPDSQSSASQRNDLLRVQQHLAALQAAAIPFKLNFVLLKEINTTPEQLDQIFEYALMCGAHRIKFLELLITQKLKAFYPYYYRLEALRDQLGEQLTLLNTGLRRTVYRYRDTPLLVELQSCTCSRGCNLCQLNRDVNFTAELRYFSCFLNPQYAVDLRAVSLGEAIESGTAYIADMARRFGDHSPIIIREHYLTHQETAYYYTLAVADVEPFVQQALAAHGLELRRHRQLKEYYFSDGSEAFATFEYVRKLAMNTYDYKAFAITQQHRVDPLGSGRIETAFGEESPMVDSVEDYCHQMLGDGFDVVLKIQWDIDYYGAGDQLTSDLSFSVGRLPEMSQALIRSQQPIPASLFALRPLTQPVPAWIAAQLHIPS